VRGAAAVDTIRYDTIAYMSFTWTRKLNIQLNLAHVARKKHKKEETKTNASAPLIQYRLRSLKAVRKEKAVRNDTAVEPPSPTSA